MSQYYHPRTRIVDDLRPLRRTVQYRTRYGWQTMSGPVSDIRQCLETMIRLGLVLDYKRA